MLVVTGTGLIYSIFIKINLKIKYYNQSNLIFNESNHAIYDDVSSLIWIIINIMSYMIHHNIGNNVYFNFLVIFTFFEKKKIFFQ